MSAFFERLLCLYFTTKTPKWHFCNRKRRCFIVITRKVFKISKNAGTVLNFSYLAVKLPNFKAIDEKLSELEPRVSHSFDKKLVSRKKHLKVLASHQADCMICLFFSTHKIIQPMKITSGDTVSRKVRKWSSRCFEIC